MPDARARVSCMNSSRSGTPGGVAALVQVRAPGRALYGALGARWPGRIAGWLACADAGLVPRLHEALAAYTPGATLHSRCTSSMSHRVIGFLVLEALMDTLWRPTHVPCSALRTTQPGRSTCTCP